MSREQISEEQYQAFCNEFESSRIENKVIWPEVDDRYKKHSQNAKKDHKVNIEKIVFCFRNQFNLTEVFLLF